MIAPDMPVPPLEYMPRRRRSRSARLIAGLAAAFALLAAGVMWGPPLYHASWMLFLERQCLKYATPVEQVAYEWHAGKLRGKTPGDLVQIDDTRAASRTRRWPSEWSRFADAIRWRTTRPNDPLLFMHSLTTTSGGEYLVVVMLMHRQPDASSFGASVTADVFSPGSVRTPVRRQRATRGEPIRHARREPFLAYASLVRIFAGQADPSDRSHFTLDYEIDGERGVLDGYLQDDLTVLFKLRDGPGLRGKKESKKGSKRALLTFPKIGERTGGQQNDWMA